MPRSNTQSKRNLSSSSSSSSSPKTVDKNPECSSLPTDITHTQRI